jgi:hypothetical protein
MVIMDEPRAKSIYGGTLAAPVFQKVMERSFKFLATKNQLGNAAAENSSAISDLERDTQSDALLSASYPQ